MGCLFAQGRHRHTSNVLLHTENAQANAAPKRLRHGQNKRIPQPQAARELPARRRQSDREAREVHRAPAPLQARLGRAHRAHTGHRAAPNTVRRSKRQPGVDQPNREHQTRQQQKHQRGRRARRQRPPRAREKEARRAAPEATRRKAATPQRGRSGQVFRRRREAHPQHIRRRRRR